MTETARWLEWQDWANPVLQEPFAVEQGRITVTDRSGSGIEWDDKRAACPGMRRPGLLATPDVGNGRCVQSLPSHDAVPPPDASHGVTYRLARLPHGGRIRYQTVPGLPPCSKPRTGAETVCRGPAAVVTKEDAWLAKLECAVANRQRDLAEKLPRVCAAGGRYVEMLRRRPPQYSCG